MSQFVIDASTLRSLRTELGLLHTRLQAMPGLVYGFEGLLGGDNMDQAVEDFCTSWHHGVGEVAGEISDLMAGLDKACDAYQRIDDRVRHRATAGWWGGPRPITGAPVAAITTPGAGPAETPLPTRSHGESAHRERSTPAAVTAAGSSALHSPQR